MNLKNSWTINGLLAVILLLLATKYIASNPFGSAHAAGGGWATDDTMVLPLRTQNERMVLIDTQKKQIMVYLERNNGSFGLIGAHSYKYDIEMIDTEGAKGGAK